MNKSIFLLPLCAGILSPNIETNAKKRQKPNIVFIYADDIGFGDLSCNGTSSVQTPNTDLIAKEGIRFTDAHCGAPTSTPSRYAMLTGEYAWRRKGTGVTPGDAAIIISPERYTLADMFKDAGYNTAVVGKWHLGLGSERGTQDWNGTIKPNPSDIGFDYSYIMAATADRTPCIFVENGKGVGIDWFRSFASMLNIEIPEGAAPDSENHIKAWLSAKKGGRRYLVEQSPKDDLALRDGQWKLIPATKSTTTVPSTKLRFGNSLEDQLYDLSADKGERKNIAKENAERVTKMKQKISEIKAAVKVQ